MQLAKSGYPFVTVFFPEALENPATQLAGDLGKIREGERAKISADCCRN